MRNGSGVYSLPSGYAAATGETATAAQHNEPLEDLQTDMNTARPIVAGGTGATTAATARANLGVSSAVATKGSGYTALTSDRGKVLRFTGAYTLALTAAATLGDGWSCVVKADGGAVTIDANGSETIDGAETLTVNDGAAVTLVCDGSAFYAVTDSGGATYPFGHCYFQYTDATTCTLFPKDGNLLKIAGLVHEIPAAGITVDTTGLSATTLYYAYAYMDAGTMTLELSATAPATDSTAGNIGIRIKTGASSRTLVGMVYTNGSTQFTAPMVISYFNPVRRVIKQTESGSADITSTTFVAIGTAVYFLYFSGRPIPQPTLSCPVDVDSAVIAYLAVLLNGSNNVADTCATAATYESMTVHGSDQTPSQGRSYFQGWGATNGGTATFGYTAGSRYMQTFVEFWG